MATANFYTINCDHRKLNKVKGTDYTVITEGVSIRIKEPCDIMNPILLLNKKAGDTSLNEANYLSIPSPPFNNRYYYIDDISVMTGGMYQLSCSIDPLETYKAEINNLTAWIERSETDKNSFLEDSAYIYSETQELTQLSFPTQPLQPSDNLSYEYVLIVSGGNGGKQTT